LFGGLLLTVIIAAIASVWNCILANSKSSINGELSKAIFSRYYPKEEKRWLHFKLLFQTVWWKTGTVHSRLPTSGRHLIDGEVL